MRESSLNAMILGYLFFLAWQRQLKFLEPLLSVAGTSSFFLPNLPEELLI